MLMYLPPPVFADATTVVGLLVLIFTVVGWLVNLANSQNNPPPPPQNRPRPPRPRRDRVQNEIDIFLKEVRGQKPEDDIVVESLPPEPRRRGGAPPPPVVPRPEAPPAPRQRGRLGHISSHMDSHVGETLASHHLESHVGEPRPVLEVLEVDAAAQMAAMPSRGAANKTPLPMLALLRDKQGIRHAMIVNEVLSKPKSLREE